MRAGFQTAYAALAFLAAVTPASAEMVSLSGQVTYRERIALPAGASLHLTLVDLTAPGAPTRVDVRAPIGSPGQVPLTFALNFDDQAIVPEHQHGLIAEIIAGDQPWFRNEQAYPLDPLAPAAPVIIITTPAERPTGAIASPSQPGAPGPDTLIGVTWRATQINGEIVSPDVDSTLSISADSRVGGRGGCNSYFAQAQISGTSLGLSAIAATRMACASGVANAQEVAFFNALEAARAWRIGEDGHLVLLDAGNKELIRFAAVTR